MLIFIIALIVWVNVWYYRSSTPEEREEDDRDMSIW